MLWSRQEALQELISSCDGSGGMGMPGLLIPEKVVVKEIMELLAKKSLWQPVFGAEQSKYSMYRGEKSF